MVSSLALMRGSRNPANAEGSESVKKSGGQLLNRLGSAFRQSPVLTAERWSPIISNTQLPHDVQLFFGYQ